MVLHLAVEYRICLIDTELHLYFLVFKINNVLLNWIDLNWRQLNITLKRITLQYSIHVLIFWSLLLHSENRCCIVKIIACEVLCIHISCPRIASSVFSLIFALFWYMVPSTALHFSLLVSFTDSCVCRKSNSLLTCACHQLDNYSSISTTTD
jgi:hypothetical protein